MQNKIGRKTEQAHWDAAWQLPIKARLPSRHNAGVLNVTRLFEWHVRPSFRYIEIGCAPGKILAWVASVLKAEAAGLDYSEIGIAKFGVNTMGLLQPLTINALVPLLVPEVRKGPAI